MNFPTLGGTPVFDGLPPACTLRWTFVLASISAPFSARAGPRPVRDVPVETFGRCGSSSKRASASPTLPAAFRRGSPSTQRSYGRNRPGQGDYRASEFPQTVCDNTRSFVPDTNGL